MDLSVWGKAVPTVFLTLVIPLLLTWIVSYRGQSIPSKIYQSKVFKDWESHLHDVRFLLRYLRPQTETDTKYQIALLAVALSCLTAGRILHVLSPLMFRGILDQITTANGQAPVFPWKPIVLYILVEHELKSLVSHVQWVVDVRAADLIGDRMVTAGYRKVMELSADYHDNKTSGTVWLTIRDSGDKVCRYLTKIFLCNLPDILDLILTAIAISNVCGTHLIGIIALIVAVYAAILGTMPTYDNENYREMMTLYNRRDDYASDAISNWWTVFLFGRTEYETEQHVRATAEARVLTEIWIRNTFLAGMTKQSVMVVGYFIIGLLVSREIFYTARRSGADLAMVLSLWGGVVSRIRNMAEFKKETEAFITDVERLLAILRRDSSVPENDNAQPFTFHDGTITFQNVSFSYDDKSHDDKSHDDKSHDDKSHDDKSHDDKSHDEKTHDSVHDITFTIPGGQTLAIVGESGGGKSTILKLLMRGYETSSGSISIDKQNVRDVQKASLLEHMSIVPQSIGVFNASLLANLRYAKADATMEECEEVCRAVGLHEKIVSVFEEGYDTVIGEMGGKLSGGEVQRLAIARVLLRDARIVLLDEAMSSLDSETEERIQRYLGKWCEGRTVVLVAHRLASVAHVDKVLAVRDGRVVEQGGVEELLERKGYFWELWGRQKLA